MSKIIIKLKGYYFEYSSISDRPVTLGMSLDEFRRYYQKVHGASGLASLPDRMARVEAKGTSGRSSTSAEDALLFNRAGPGEANLTTDEIYRAYCLREPIRGGWLPSTTDER